MSFPTAAALFFSTPVRIAEDPLNTDGDPEKNLTLLGAVKALEAAAFAEVGFTVAVEGVLGAFAAEAEVENGPPPGSYRYWRLNITAVNSDAQQIALLFHVGLYISGVEITDDSMAATASSSFYGAPGDEVIFNPTNALTPVSGSGWATDGASHGQPMPQWWQVDLGAGNEQEPDMIRIRPQTRARSPYTFQILASNDGSTWDTIKSYVNQSSSWGTANTEVDWSLV